MNKLKQESNSSISFVNNHIMTDLIKRPEEFYVGFKNQKGNNLPLAFLTPYDTTAAFKKRKESVDIWAKSYCTGYVNGKPVYEPNPDAINIKNEPLSGFLIAKSVKRTSSWNGGNVVWRIEDPRGFEWEIPSANLAQIIAQTGISAGGTINGRCIIGRLGAINILIPEGTDLWDKMEADIETRTNREKAKVITDLKPGDAIKLKNGDEGFYLGKRKVLVKTPDDPSAYKVRGDYNYTHHYHGKFHTTVSKNEYHLIVVGLGVYNYKEDYYPVKASKGNPPIVSVDAMKQITPDKVKKMLTSAKTYVSFSGKSGEATESIEGVCV